ncbi:MAG TPA: DinB family protein [Anaerolineae bacterium]|nr:DinB family protein [Anaerolineae bacterium]
MNENILEKLIEHNNWANLCIIKACAMLSDEQLDAEPQTVTKGSIRLTLLHLVSAQQGYLALLTLPVEARRLARPAITDLQESARISGEGLLALARNWPNQSNETQLQTTDGYFVAPWVVMLQVINHATEHREQIKSMLSSLGVTPPEIDGWSYGEATQTLVPISTSSKSD